MNAAVKKCLAKGDPNYELVKVGILEVQKFAFDNEGEKQVLMTYAIVKNIKIPVLETKSIEDMDMTESDAFIWINSENLKTFFCRNIISSEVQKCEKQLTLKGPEPLYYFDLAMDNNILQFQIPDSVDLSCVDIPVSDFDSTSYSFKISLNVNLKIPDADQKQLIKNANFFKNEIDFLKSMFYAITFPSLFMNFPDFKRDLFPALYDNHIGPADAIFRLAYFLNVLKKKKFLIMVFRSFILSHKDHNFLSFEEFLLGLSLMQPSVQHGGKMAEYR